MGPTPSIPDTAGVSRLAPSPTGALHLGNARTFLMNWAMARQGGWRLPLRIEDLDTPRVKPGAIDGTIRTLTWLGLTWDGPPHIQSDDVQRYHDAMHVLAQHGHVYPCAMTRSEISAAASAPNEGQSEARFPPSLRPGEIPREFLDTGSNWRFVTDDAPICFDDEFAGPCRVDTLSSVGDFPVWTMRAQPSYQLAVVVDDHEAGVNIVVRGNDLIDSTGRQIMIARALGIAPPRYMHLPLVRGQDGRRLAKRHGDTRLDTYCDAGVSPERIVGLMAFWCGLTPRPCEMDAAEFQGRFSVDRIPAEDIVYDEEAERWLSTS